MNTSVPDPLAGHSILIAYATKHGATAEIAGKIGEVLGASGLAVRALPADRVHDLTPYTAVEVSSWNSWIASPDAPQGSRWRKTRPSVIVNDDEPGILPILSALLPDDPHPQIPPPQSPQPPGPLLPLGPKPLPIPREHLVYKLSDRVTGSW